MRRLIVLVAVALLGLFVLTADASACGNGRGRGPLRRLLFGGGCGGGAAASYGHTISYAAPVYYYQTAPCPAGTCAAAATCASGACAAPAVVAAPGPYYTGYVPGYGYPASLPPATAHPYSGYFRPGAYGSSCPVGGCR